MHIRLFQFILIHWGCADCNRRRLCWQVKYWSGVLSWEVCGNLHLLATSPCALGKVADFQNSGGLGVGFLGFVFLSAGKKTKQVEFGWFPRCPLGGLAAGRLAHLFKLSFRMQSADQTDHSTSHARRPMGSYQVLSRLQMAIAMRWRCLSGFWKVSQTNINLQYISL